MGKLADNHQQEGLTQFMRELGEGLLHFIGEFIRSGIHCRDRHIKRTFSDKNYLPADSPPAIDYSPPQDRGQPRALTSIAVKMSAALPGTAQSLLHDVLGVMAVTHQSVSDAIKCRGVIVNQVDKISPRKRHPLPLR